MWEADKDEASDKFQYLEVAHIPRCLTAVASGDTELVCPIIGLISHRADLATRAIKENNSSGFGHIIHKADRIEGCDLKLD
jgi:hypothetical protein